MVTLCRSVTAVLALAAASAASAGTPPAPTPASASAKIAATIDVIDFRYSPTPVRIRAGERVRFVNDDDEAHTVTASDKSFDSAGMDTGDTWDRVFTKPGTYEYFCVLHPFMKGVILVSK